MAGIFLLLGVFFSHFDTVMMILTVIFLSSAHLSGVRSQQFDLPNSRLMRSPFYKLRSPKLKRYFSCRERYFS
ncbi:hypothetical protein [Nostoc sp.]|uniref:hypothetical protein n=1 Tax=Nostoc sp. TaxID=1180 RepID=UPI002FFB6797